MAGGEPDAGSSGLRREPVAGGRGIASSEAVIDALRTVYDPGIPLNIYDLGLIYRLDVADDGRFDRHDDDRSRMPCRGAMPGAVATRWRP